MEKVMLRRSNIETWIKRLLILVLNAATKRLSHSAREGAGYDFAAPNQRRRPERRNGLRMASAVEF